LKEKGYTVITVWEKDYHDNKDLTLSNLVEIINGTKEDKNTHD